MSGRRLLRYFLLVGLAYGVATLGAGLTDYLTRFELSTTTNLAISGGVGLLTALCLGAIDLAKPAPAQAGPAAPPYAASASAGQTYPGRAYPGQPYPGQPYPGRPAGPPPGRPRSKAGAGLVFAAVVLLAVCAGGGYALTTGVHWAADRLSAIATPPWLNKTRDPGVDRLATRATAQNGPLTLTVLSVRVNDQVTMVDATATNTDNEAISMPVFQNAQLTLPGATLSADPNATKWPDVPPNGEATGTLVFDGVLPAGATEVTLSFSRIYSLNLDAPRNISVRIELRPQ
jgi:hypothetical protein